MKPTLKAPGTMRLKLKYAQLLSNFASNFNLRRYNPAPSADCTLLHYTDGRVVRRWGLGFRA